MKKRFTFLGRMALAAGAFLCMSHLHAQNNLILQTGIQADSDDAEERGLNATSGVGQMDLTSSDIELVVDGSDGNQFVGLRFATVNLPKNAIIDSAFIQFTVDEIDAGSTSVTIKTEDSDSSATFTTAAFNISSRATSTDSVMWNNIAAWNTVGVKTNDQRSTNISSLVSSMINRPGWNQGNPITLLITGTGERTAEAHNGTGAESAELIVYYSAPITTVFPIVSGNDDAEQDVLTGAMDLTSTDLEFTTDGSSTQAIGLRFQNVSIPQGSVIQSAFIQFQVDETNSTDTVNISWGAELTDNAAAYTATTNNIAGRTFNTTQTFWNLVPAWPTVGIAGLDQRTPDVATQVQTIVNRSGWISGNAMAFGAVDPSVVSVPGYNANSSKRTAESYDGSVAGAPKLIVTYIPPARFIAGNFPITKGVSWKYDDSGLDLGTAWTANNYNDSTWAFGDAPIGYSNPVATTVDFGTDPNDKHITTYLRHTFSGTNTAQYDSLIFDVLRDDGAIVYINGVEAFRTNMPNGIVGFDTTAVLVVGGADETTYYRFTVDNTLTSGLNVISVELHQQAGNSSDLSFDMEVTGKLPPLTTSTYPVESGDEWNFLDDGTSLDSIAWKTLNFNDTVWGQGISPLGYSNSVATQLSFGPDPTNKYITYYFRKRFNISNIFALSDSLILNLKKDDGAIVYINGNEIIRSNLPTGAVNYRTNASSIVSGAAEDLFYPTTVSKNIFTQGDNIIAVEVHQRDSSSSDLSFDFAIAAKPNARKACSGPNDLHVSCFTSLFPTAQGPDFVIPETHAFQVLIEQGDTYSNTNVRTTVPGNNDFTGYIGRTGSSIDGFLGINHENTPGGVSILDLRYNDSIKLWTVDSSQAVDFYNNDLVTTTRNCSGGITPWGTFITSEETGNSGDANADGYEDVGWQVEIDPITRKVKEYGTPGKQEKLWAMGRMNHENVAVSSDSVTAYQGVDAGSGCLFKFIANTPADLSSGILYALKLDSGRAQNGEPLSSTGTWIVIPNSTQADRNNSNSLAISLGATAFNGIEDAEIGTIDGKIYFTAKGSNRVYRFNDLGTANFNEFETFVGGRNYLINYGGAVISEPWSSGNDNLCFDDLGNLYVLQDGDRDHVWMVGLNHTQAIPQVDIFAKLPAGSEPCGMTFTPDYKFMFLSVQHPSGGNSSTIQMDASGYGADMAKSTTVVIARKEFLGNYAPMVAASNLSFTTTACDSIDFSFNTGSGNGHIVIAKEGSKVDANPMDGISYKVSDTLGNGDNLGGSNFVIYDGLDSNLTLKGLQTNTTYHVSIFEYNAAPNKYYQIDLTLDDSATTAAVTTSAITGAINSFVLATETYSVTNTTGSSYVWDSGAGAIISGQGSNQIQVTWPANPGNADLKVIETNASGCEGDTVTQTINFGTVGIESLDLSAAIKVGPNPTDGITTISLSGLANTFDVVVYDFVGKKVLENRNLKNSAKIDLSNHNSGTYILHVTSGNKMTTKMIVVK
ncbi:MAG: secreted PhoX family phosphatase [Vicingaceae bacterium]|jgi:secreted PhoX family phosphatase